MWDVLVLPVSFCYERLNFVINYSDFVILGVDLLVFGSKSVCHITRKIHSPVSNC